MLVPDEERSVLVTISGSALRVMMSPEKERMCPYMHL
jgi:hypothetical protein